MKLSQARKQWARRRRQYGVGYIASGNIIFYSRWGLKADGNATCVPMSLREARQLLRAMPSQGAAIFRLTPIATGGGAR